MYIPPELKDQDEHGVRAAVMDFLRGNLTEERTDAWLDALMDTLGAALPWWIPGGIVRAILDHLVPEMLLDSLERVLAKV